MALAYRAEQKMPQCKYCSDKKFAKVEFEAIVDSYFAVTN